MFGQPAQTAESLGFASAGSATTSPEATSATVVASFWTAAGISRCLDFNSGGTLAGLPSVPAGNVLGGGYLGTPGAFTVFVVTLGSGAAPAPFFVGLGIGPVVIGVSIAPQIPIPGMLGFETSSC